MIFQQLLRFLDVVFFFFIPYPLHVICFVQFHGEQLGVCGWRRRGGLVGFCKRCVVVVLVLVVLVVLGGWGRGFGWEGQGGRSTQFNKEHSKVRKRQSALGASLPAVVLDHVSQLDDELSLLVLLTALKSVLIFPAQGGFTVFTVDISHSM